MVEKKSAKKKAAPKKAEEVSPEVVEKPIEDPVEQLEDDYANEQNRIYDLAEGVLRGDFGFSEQRKKALAEDYDAVMKVVKDIRSGKNIRK